MPTPASDLAPAFAVLCLAVASLWPVAAFFGSRRTPGASPLRSALVVGLAVAAWMALTFALARAGALRDFARTPPAILRVFVPAFALTFGLSFSPIGRRIALGLPLEALLGFQVFRVLVEIALDLLHRRGALPVQMTFEGLNADILTGASAPIAAWLAHRERPSRGLLVAWNVFGLATLGWILAIAMTSMPTAMRLFHQDPPNTIVAEAPWIWLPTVLVQSALAGHLLALRKLLARAP